MVGSRGKGKGRRQKKKWSRGGVGADVGGCESPWPSLPVPILQVLLRSTRSNNGRVAGVGESESDESEKSDD